MARIDLTGQRFGRLTALEPAGVRYFLSGRRSSWWCLCDCGERTNVTSSNLRSGQIRSCGCGRRGKTGRKPLDLTGQRFGRLVVLGPAEAHAAGVAKVVRTAWLCRCDCGKEKAVTTHSLRTCGQRTCGCGRGRRL